MQTFGTAMPPHILSGMASSTMEDVQVPSAWDIPDSPLTPLSELADEYPWSNKSPLAKESSQLNKSSQSNVNNTSQFNHSNESCDNEPPFSNEASTNAPMGSPGGRGGQAGDPEVAGRCNRGGQAKRSRSGQQKAVVLESDEFGDVNASSMGKFFEVTQVEPLPEGQVLGLDGDIFLSCVSSCCRSVQSGTSHIADFDLNVVQQILHRVVAPGHKTINPYRITRNSAPTNLTNPSDVERWYEIETMKGFLEVCMDLENKESLLQFSYMISAIQFVSKISMYVPSCRLLTWLLMVLLGELISRDIWDVNDKLLGDKLK